MSQSWKLDAVPGPFKFALIIEDQHLPYFSHVDARHIIKCLEGADFCNAPYLLEREGEIIRFMPCLSGVIISKLDSDY